MLNELQDIIDGCTSNDRVSQEKLYRQLYPGLHALCRQFFKDEQDIITALNNGMLNVYKNIATYDPDKGDLFCWCYTIVRNAAITYLRSQKKFNSIHLNEELNYDYSENPLHEKPWEELFLLLDRLSPATRAVGSLFYKEGFLVREIAEMLDISEGTVKWHLSECREKVSKSYHHKLNFLG